MLMQYIVLEFATGITSAFRPVKKRGNGESGGRGTADKLPTPRRRYQTRFAVSHVLLKGTPVLQLGSETGWTTVLKFSLLRTREC